MKWMLAGAAVAALSLMLAAPASASMCSNSCDHDYSVCNSLNGGDAQRMCMPKWMQCKKACTGGASTTHVTSTTKTTTVSTKPKR